MTLNPVNVSTRFPPRVYNSLGIAAELCPTGGVRHF
jgi:hypothetical protein